MNPGHNEGRIRPSLIAADAADRPPTPPPPNEGRIRPSLIAARRRRRRGNGRRRNEGRIRPSLIAAGRKAAAECRPGIQRGANSPLPHCGRSWAAACIRAGGNEGRIRPSLIAACWSAGGGGGGSGQRGANSPLPHCGRISVPAALRDAVATRGEFAPPSLRRYLREDDEGQAPVNEGRIRPSLIAAIPVGERHNAVVANEGRIRPSLIAASTRPGRPWPPTATRGEFAPPSLRRGDDDLIVHPRRQRGANSPLPHCGRTSPS